MVYAFQVFNLPILGPNIVTSLPAHSLWDRKELECVVGIIYENVSRIYV